MYVFNQYIYLCDVTFAYSVLSNSLAPICPHIHAMWHRWSNLTVTKLKILLARKWIIVFPCCSPCLPSASPVFLSLPTLLPLWPTAHFPTKTRCPIPECVLISPTDVHMQEYTQTFTHTLRLIRSRAFIHAKIN